MWEGFRRWESNKEASTYSSRIQLPTDVPPQLIPVTMLPASDSRRGLSRLDVFMDMGCAPLRATESRRPNTVLIAPLDDPPLMSIAPDGRVSLPVVGWSAVVELGKRDPSRAEVAMSMGVARPPIPSCTTPSSNSGKVGVSYSRSSKVSST